MVGLNTVPTARMDRAGILRIGASHLDPYNHAYAGIQLASPLYVNLRQSMLVSSVGDKPDNVYPGLDFKLRIMKEDRYSPDLVFGMDSALGHARHSSEYFTLSKRIYDFDITAGIAWGRLGSAGQIKNPFARIKHFDQDRSFTTEGAAGPDQWFTGKKIGFFGGVEYFTPLQGLSFKADIGADDYPGESRTSGFKKPDRWSLGFNYSPREWVSLAGSVIGGDKIMARVTFQEILSNWRGESYKYTAPLIYPKGAAETAPERVKGQAGMAGIVMGEANSSAGDISAVLYLSDTQPSPMQLGRAARYLAANAGPDIKSITIIPSRGNVRGQSITFSRRDLEQAMAKKTGSPEEIWHDIQFSKASPSGSAQMPRRYKILPEVEFSFAEEDTTHLHRVSIVAEESKNYGYGFFASNALRFNLHDRLYQIDKIRSRADEPVRSDIADYARRWINLDRSFVSWMGTPLPKTHLALSAGYLEEMYGGIGGEILYRPFDFPLSIGAELWRVTKRKPDSFLAMGMTDHNETTGHLNLYYDVPHSDMTVFAKAGRYLGGDHGATGGLETIYGPVKVKGFVTATNRKDKDVFGEDSKIYAGLQLSLPLGNIRFTPEGSEVRVKFAPLGRDAGQVLDKPVSLYDITEPMSYRHLGRNWQEVLN